MAQLKLEIKMKTVWYFRPLVWIVSILLTLPVIKFTNPKKAGDLSLGDLIYRTYPDPIEDITKQ